MKWLYSLALSLVCSTAYAARPGVIQGPSGNLKALTLGAITDAAGNIMVPDPTSQTGQVCISDGTLADYVALSGDITVNSSGVTAIGASKVTSSMILNSEIVNADISGSAAIDGSKIVAASVSVAGVVNTTTQTFNGVKTFDDGIKVTGLTKGIVQSDSSGTLSHSNVWTCGAWINNDCTSTPCTITVNYGGCISSVTRSSTGIYQAVFTGSFWSAEPACVVTCADSSGTRNTRTGDPSTTALDFLTYDDTGTQQDTGFSIMCIGPRT
jgi:hypothetical protein